MSELGEMDRVKTVLKGATVYVDGSFAVCDLAYCQGVITEIAPSIEPCEATTIIDLTGCYLLPGLVDVHVHLREPGFESKECIASGTAAAAHGGFTTVCSMPNLYPAPDTRENLQRQLDAITRDAVVRVVPYGCITRGQKGRGDLVDFDELAGSVVGFSDDGRGVQSDELMCEAMREARRVQRPIVAHCEVDELLRGGYIHDGEYCRDHSHRGICSESEWRQVERDIELVAKTGCQYHVCHVSTKESVALVRAAKAAGLPVSCETAPHYLLLCDEDLREEGRFKMNPPLRSSADRDALIDGVKDGTIEVVATDHAPHTDEEKSRGLAGSPFGIVGLETAFPLLYTYLVKKGVVTLERLVELMSSNPARIFGLGRGIEVGAAADFAVVDMMRGYRIDATRFVSKGHSTPFDGWSVDCSVVMSIVAGRVVFEKKED